MRRVQQEMEKASEELNFERAAALRDQLKAMQSIVERQKVVFATDYKDSDVIAMARADGEACVQIFFIRGGKLIGREYFVLEGTEDTADKEVMTEFVKQFYTEAANIPQQVMLPQEIEEAQIIGQWLRSRRGGGKVEISVPRRGQPHELVQMAAENATETLQALRTQWQADTHKQEQALAELQSALQLPRRPTALNVMIFPTPRAWQRLAAWSSLREVCRIRSCTGASTSKVSAGAPDDFASMQEMLTRRFRRWQASQEKATWLPDPSRTHRFPFSPTCSSWMAARVNWRVRSKSWSEFDLFDKVPVVGLAKQEEEIFFPNKPDSLLLPRHSQGLYLVQRIRDEAHRFAITAHRARRSKQGMASALDSIPGIGPVKRKALLKHFGSVDMIRKATVVELTAVPGINPALAESVKAHLE